MLWRLPILLSIILVVAAALRLTGLTYGLPLWLIDDEPPFILAALKMLELRTLIPALTPEAFNGILYYPPYLSYIYLLPFTAIVGVQYLLWSGPATLFTAFLSSDLSTFFVASRFINVVFGTVSVYLVYKIGSSLFSSKTAGLAGAFLVATSLLHTSLSMVGRHWLPFSLVFLLVLYVLTQKQLSEEKRYSLALIFIGLGCGISMIAPLALVFVALSYFLYSSLSLQKIFTSIWIWGGGIVGVILALLPFALHTGSTGIVVDVTVSATKSFGDFLQSPWSALTYISASESVLVLLAFGGIVFGLRYAWKEVVLLLSYFFVYVSALYWLFRFESRFMLPVVLIAALFGGYFVAKVWESRNNYARLLTLLVLCVPLIVSMRFGYLVIQNDTRAQASSWIREHVTTDQKVAVLARLTRIQTTPEAIEELRLLDATALRRVDLAEESLNNGSLHALNLSTIDDDVVLVNTIPYLKKNGYTHILYEAEHVQRFPNTYNALKPILGQSTLAARWNGFGYNTSLASNMFTQPLSVVFEDKHLGPTIEIYELP